MAGRNKNDLTTCLNHRKLDEDIEAEIARSKRYVKPLSLLMIDINWLSKHKDFHEHARDGMLLKRLVGLIKQNMRIIDTIYLYQEREFVVLLPETDKVQALSTAKRIQKIIGHSSFARENQSNEKAVVNIGVACYPWDANSRDELVKSAAAALEAAKESGRSRVCFFDFDIDSYRCHSKSAGKIRNA